MLLRLDGFGHFSNTDKPTKWTQLVPGTGSGSITLGATGRAGGNGLRLTSLASSSDSGSINLFPQNPLPSGDTIIVGFLYRSVVPFTYWATGTASETQSSGGSGQICAVRKSGSTLFWVRQNTNGTISVLRGSTVIATTTTALTQNRFKFIEIKVKLHGSTGTVEIRFNGVAAHTPVTGANTTNTGATTFDEFRFGFANTGSAVAGYMDVDDFYLCDGSGGVADDFLGEIRIDDMTGDADDVVMFTPSSGVSNVAMIDEATADGDTTFNSTAGVNDQDLFTLGSAPVPGATIVAIQLVSQVRKTDAGSALHAHVVQISGVDYFGADLAPDDDYTFLCQPWAVKPSDSTPWLEADIPTTKVGYAKTA